MTIRVTATDTETGDIETQEIPENGYVLVCEGECHISSKQIYPKSGTEVLTIKHRNQDSRMQSQTG